MYVCMLHVNSAGGDQKVWEPLELLLRKALSHHSDAKYQTPVLWKKNQCSQVMYNFSSPQIMHVKRSDQIVQHLKSIFKKKDDYED